MATPSRTRALVALLLLTAGAAAVAAWLLFVPRPRVLVGESFARATSGDVALRPGRPIRVLLSLRRRLGEDGLVDLELHALDGGDRVLQVIPVRASGHDDEVVFAMPDVSQLVGAARGRFRVVFLRRGERLAAGEFSVPR